MEDKKCKCEVINMQWVKLWTDARCDPKVQMLSEAMQRRFFMIMMMQGSGEIPTDIDQVVAFGLRISKRTCTDTKNTLKNAGLINDDWSLKNWEKRQKRLTSTERVLGS